MKNILIVTNYSAGRKKAIKYKKQLIKFVLKISDTFKFVELNKINTIDISPFDTIIAVGGDGTVNKLLPFLVNTEKTLAIVPCGTANLLAAKLSLPTNLNKNLELLNSPKIKLVDTMTIDDKYCILRCGFGYDSDIICKTPQSLKNKFGYLAYVIIGLLFAFKLNQKQYKIKIDEDTLDIKASCVIIANSANMCSSYYSIASNSKLDDGIIDIFILKTTNPVLFFIELLLNAVNIRHNSSRAMYYKAKTICIESPYHICHIDGEKQYLEKNSKISVKKQAIKIIS